MKKKSLTPTAILMMMVIATGLALFSSCEGPAGLDGQDANETCAQCHNNGTLLLAKLSQTANSQHQMGTSFERNGSSCAPCHTHAGFLEVLATGAQSTTGDMSNPLPVNCRTCHNIHQNFDTTDYSLTTTAAVPLWINGVEVDLGDASNGCVNCHQPRIPDPLPAIGGGEVTITSSRWGPHHGTQAAILYSTAGYEIAGSEDYGADGSHPHTLAGCTQCHMADPLGTFAGGHTFSMTDGETEHVEGCTQCHTDIEEFDLNGAVTEIEGLLDQLHTALVNAGYVNESSGLVNASSSSPLVVSSDMAGAILNYYMVEEDGSMGVHNPKYVKALLANSLALFN